MPKYVTREETSWTGEPQLVTREEPTGFEAAVGILGLFASAHQGHKWSKAEKLVERANAEMASGNHDEAISLISTAIEMYPELYDGYVIRGICYGLAQRHHEAIKDFSRAIEIDKNNADFYDSRAYSYSQIGDIANGLRDASMAIKLQPNQDSYYVQRARLLVELGNMEQAIADYNRAMQLNPAEADYYKGRAYTYAKMHDYQRAIADYSRGITLDPNDPLAYQLRGEAYAKMGDYQKAIADYSRAITLDPNEPQPYQLRGEAYQALGDHARSSADFHQAQNLALPIIKRLLDEIRSQPTTLSQFTDKDRAKRVRSLMEDILFSSSKRLTAAQLKEVNLAVQYIEQMPMLNELITAQKLKDELEATDEIWIKLSKKWNYLHYQNAFILFIILWLNYDVFYKNFYLPNIHDEIILIKLVLPFLLSLLFEIVLISKLLSFIMSLPEYPKMKAKRESLRQKIPPSKQYEDLYRQFGGPFNSSKYIAMRDQWLNYINRLVDSTR